MTREDDAVSKYKEALHYGQPLASSTGTIAWYHIFSVIDPLADIYLKRVRRALQKDEAAAGSKSMEVKHYGGLIKELEQKTDIWMNATLTCCLAHYHKIALEPQRIKSTISKLVTGSIAILSDNDESNDWFAYLQPGRIMEAVQDEENFEEAWKRLEKLIPSGVNLSRWFLCDQCKQSIHLVEGVHVCLESFQLRFFHSGCFDKLQRNTRSQKVAVISPNANDTDAIMTAEQKQERERLLCHWKTQLQERYVCLEDSVDITPGSSTSGSPSTHGVSELQELPSFRPWEPQVHLHSQTVTARWSSDDEELVEEV